MTEKQAILFKLLEEIDEICNRYDIPYYLAGGTLIGAIRHKGFIPWDDDLDIMITRDNWYKFIEACKTELPANRVLEAQEINRDYTNTFGRYMDTSTTAVHKADLLGTASAGFVIDIIPLDPVPDEAALKKYFEDMLLYSDLINIQGLYSYRFNVNKDRYFEALKRIKKEGKEKVLSELEDRMFRYPENECDYYALRWGGVPFLFEKEMFGSSRRVEFEGLMAGAPDRVSDYLVRHFGDEWTTIPPHDEQMEHNAVFSLDIDFKSFQNDYLKYVDADKIISQWLERKKYFFMEMDQRLAANKDRASIIAELHRMEIEKALKESKLDINEAVENRRFDLLSELFDPYVDNQWDRELIGREDFGGMQRFSSPIFIDIPDDVFFAAMMTLVNTNRVSKADRLIDVRGFAKGELTQELISVKKFINDFRQIISDYDIGKADEAIKAAEKFYDDNPSMMSIEMFLCRVYIEKKEFEKAKRLIDSCRAKYPDEGYFTKYLGDYFLEKTGDRKKAIECYEEAKETTLNGIALLEIDETLRGMNG